MGSLSAVTSLAVSEPGSAGADRPPAPADRLDGTGRHRRSEAGPRGPTDPEPPQVRGPTEPPPSPNTAQAPQQAPPTKAQKRKHIYQCKSPLKCGYFSVLTGEVLWIMESWQKGLLPLMQML